MIDRLVGSGVLVRKQRNLEFIREMSNEEFMKYVSELYQGETINTFRKKDSRLYQIARERKLIDRLVSGGILVRERLVLRIPEKTKQDIISLVEKTVFSYRQIANRLGVSNSFMGNIVKKAIEDGNLDDGYLRPGGWLYLENVRRDSIRSLENCLNYG